MPASTKGHSSAESTSAPHASDAATSPLSVEKLFKTAGIAVAAGTSLWYLRLAGLLTAAIAARPAWSQFDPIPLLPGSNDQSADLNTDDPAPARDDEAEDERAAAELLDGAKPFGADST